ncbi:MAG: hypothetical protein IE936_12750, partial [Moraxella osloensis]|nr:hypothetical protein [Moraxella osloensis]
MSTKPTTRLQRQVLVTLLSILVIAMIALGIYGKLSYDSTYNKTLVKMSHDMTTAVKKSINTKFQVGRTNAVSMAANGELIKAVANKDVATTRQVLQKIIQAYGKNTQYKNLQIHIHTPENRSFVRSWTDKQGDDLSSFRFGVAKVIQTQQAISVFELG